MENANDICQALMTDRTIDITTIGRRSGQPRRIETWFYRADGRLYLTGTPGRRDWYANLVHLPSFTFHLKESTTADLAATATPVTDPEQRRVILASILSDLGRSEELETWVSESPLAHVALEQDLDCPGLLTAG